MFVYGEPAGRVIFVRAALISVEEAARISSESDGVISRNTMVARAKDWHLTRVIFQLMTALLSICLPRRYGESARNTQGGV